METPHYRFFFNFNRYFSLKQVVIFVNNCVNFVI